MAAVHVVGVDLRRVAPGQIGAQTGGRHQRGHAKAVHPVAHGVAVAVPVRHHHGQARGHGLDGHDAEGLLDVVRQRTEHVGPGPGRAALRGVAPIQRHHPHRRAGQRRRLGVGLGNELVGVPAALHQHHLLPTGRRSLRRLLQRLVHGQRVGLGVERQPAHEQHHQGLGVHAQRTPGLGAVTLAVGEILRVDAQRNHRQLRQHQARGAQALREVVHLRLQQPLHMGLHGRAGADHGVPGLHGRGDPLRQRVHGPGAAGGVGDAAQAPGRVAVRRTLPGVVADARARVVHQPRLGQGRQVLRLHRLHRLRALQGRGRSAKLLGVLQLLHLQPELLIAGVLQKAPQKALARRMAAHELGAAGAVGLGVEIDAGIHRVQRPAARAAGASLRIILPHSRGGVPGRQGVRASGREDEVRCAQGQPVLGRAHQHEHGHSRHAALAVGVVVQGAGVGVEDQPVVGVVWVMGSGLAFTHLSPSQRG